MKAGRYGLLILLFAATLLAMAACGKKQLAEPVGVLSTETLFEGNVNLNIYAVQNDRFMLELFERFQYDIFKTKAAGLTVTWFEDMESLIKTVTTEMMGGGGPDVLFFYPDTFDSSYNLIKNNMFADLNPIIEDTDYKLDSLNNFIMDAGIYKDKRLFMPLNYYVDMFLAVDEFLAKGITFDDLETMEDLMEVHEEYITSKAGDDSTFNFAYPFSLPEFLNMSNYQVVDFSTKKLVFEDSELKTYVDWYKELQKYFAKEDILLENYSNASFGPILEGDMVFLNDFGFTNPGSIKYVLSIYKAVAVADEAKLLSLSELTSNTSSANLGLCAAVNKKSKHQTEAFELIKCALSKTLQESRWNNLIPVRNSVLDKQMIDLSIKNTYSFDFEGTTVQIVPLTEKEEAQYRRFVKEPGNVIIRDNKYYSIMTDTFADYIAGKANWEDTLKRAKHQLKVYLHE